MTRTARRRRALNLTAVVSLLLMLATLATVRPVGAAEEWSTYSMTYRGAAGGRQGLVGASGGLVAFSGGPGVVSGRLDAAPSGTAEASSVEPGTMGRLVVGQANSAGAPETDADVLTARAAAPGDQPEDSATQAGPQQAGPLTIAGAEATAAVTSAAATSRASVATLRVADQSGSASAFATAARAWRTRFVDGDGGLAGAQQPRATSDTDALRIEGAYGDGRADADTTARTLTSSVEVGVERAVVQGALVLEGVVGRATAAVEGTTRSSAATMDVATVTLAGAPVTIDEHGLSVTDEQVVAGAEVTAANEQLQAILTAAGIEVRLLGTVEQSDDRAARASSGGVAIHVTTPSTDAVPRNELGIVLGRGEATLAAEPAPPPITGGIGVIGGTTPTGDDGSTSSTDADDDSSTGDRATTDQAPVVVPSPGGPDAAEDPAVADPAAGDGEGTAPSADQPQLVAAGVTLSRRTAYAGFAAWMLFTSTLPLAGAFVLGRRP